MKNVDIRPLFGFPRPNVPTTNASVKDVLKGGRIQPEQLVAFIGDRGYFALRYQKQDRLALAVCPNPIHVYFSVAAASHFRAKEIEGAFLVESDHQFTEIAFEVFTQFIQLRLSSVILLHTALEAFINSIIPENASYFRVERSGGNLQQVSCNKEQCERLGFTEKFKKVVNATTGFDYRQIDQVRYDQVLSFSILRDSVVHLKTTAGNKDQYFKVFDNLIHSDIDGFFESIEHYMNCKSPDFIVWRSL